MTTIRSKRMKRRRERGMALLISTFAIMLLAAFAGALVFMSNSETTVNSNYRSTQQAYFDARSGLEEARARLLAGDPLVTPSGLPGASNASGIIYITNPLNAESITPWTSGTAYFDTELCHENYNHTTGALATTNPGALLQCGSANMPASSTYASWSTTTASTAPNTGASGALYYKWVRISEKINASADPGDSTTAGTSLYVDLSSLSSTTKPGYQVCWNNSTGNELVSSTGCSGSNYPVYKLTSLAVTPSGSRRMVQSEVAIIPGGASSPFQWALFGTSNGCSSIILSGNASTDAYNSAGGKTYANTENNTGGSIGSEGNILLSGNGTVGGDIYVPIATDGGSGSCSVSGGKVNYGVSASGNATCSTVSTCSSTNANDPLQTLTTAAPTTPTTPAVTYSGTTFSYSSTTSPAMSNFSSATAAPGVSLSGNSANVTVAGQGGTYYMYDVSLSGGATLTLGPGTYNINSLSLSGGSTLAIAANVTYGTDQNGNACTSASPCSCLLNALCGGAEPCNGANSSVPKATASCQVTLNIQGCNAAASGCNNPISQPLNLSGGSPANGTDIADNLLVYYAGSQQVTVSGGSSAYFALDAPNSPVTVSGNSAIYGSIVGSTINDSGNAAVHYDQALASAFGGSSTGAAQVVMYKELMY